jgi:hypothetical protein
LITKLVIDIMIICPKISMAEENKVKEEETAFTKCDRIIKGLSAGVCDLKDYGSSIIGYKSIEYAGGYATAEVEIPNDGKSIIVRPYRYKINEYNLITKIMSEKLRTNQYNIKKILNKSDNTIYYSIHNSKYKYEEGGKYSEPNMNDDIYKECTNGLHFFMKEEDADNYARL